MVKTEIIAIRPRLQTEGVPKVTDRTIVLDELRTSMIASVPQNLEAGPTSPTCAVRDYTGPKILVTSTQKNRVKRAPQARALLLINVVIISRVILSTDSASRMTLFCQLQRL